MTLKEMKIKAFSLIEEYYPEKTNLADDDDVLNKINGVVNAIQLDLMPYKKIPTKTTVSVTKAKNTLLLSEIDDLYQLNKIVGCDYELIANYEIVFDVSDFSDDDTVSVDIYYYKYPELCDIEFEATDTQTKEEVIAEYDEEYEFELDKEVLEIMPYGIAADLLKMDMISNYGKYFYERYLELKNKLDSRRTSGVVSFTGGVDV